MNKWMIWGYHYFWKHPFGRICLKLFPSIVAMQIQVVHLKMMILQGSKDSCCWTLVYFQVLHIEVKMFLLQGCFNLLFYTWVFQVCQFCAFSPKQPTKRQQKYISRRSRCIYSQLLDDLFLRQFSGYRRIQTTQSWLLNSFTIKKGRLLKFTKPWKNVQQHKISPSPGDSIPDQPLSPIVGGYLTSERVTFSPSPKKRHKELPGSLPFTDTVDGWNPKQPPGMYETL